KELAVTTSDWNIGVRMVPTRDVFTVDPSNQQQMTQGVEALHASQPTVLTQGVNAIQPSKFVQNITLEPRPATAGEGGDATDEEKPPPPKEYRGDRVFSSPLPAETPSGPLVHFGTHEKNVVVEVPYESGTIVFVSDPYMVSNAGIQLADNAHLATNLVATSSGTVAFDEYHQGYSNDSNRFLQFFAGTPVVAIFLQAVVLIGFIFYSQSRRFARPVPEPEPDRLSKLEYVTAMAELQQRTRAWDLAVENIYTDFRRRAARLFGIDVSQATSDELAKRIAERTGLAAPDLRDTLFKCEEIIRGEPTNKSEVIRLVDTIRSIESTLGLRRSRFGK
ncbi:MAG TPA: hypothetical protein VL501_05260, partial [Pyrinomonadaceae bacterium]|nr:hypothetical protein [Pyrinomonadaceae bacterium]